MTKHTCTKCGEIKPRAEFYKDGRRLSGVTPYCKVCQKQQALDRYYTKLRGTHSSHSQLLKQCEECGEKFTPRRSTALYCSPQCGRRSRGKKKRLNLPPVECLNCGTWFSPRERSSVTCSRPCYRTLVWGERGYSHESRARFYGVKYQRIERQAVFERDKWNCGICYESIDPNVKHPDPMSASVDHIVPLSRGGTHTLENVQASHLRCNVRKNAAAPDWAGEAPES